MKFEAKSGGDFEPVPAGNKIAICNAIVDLGVQKGRGRYPDPKHEVYIRFELPTERIKYEKDGVEVEGPMSIGRRFTASMSSKANLRQFIESWFSKKFPTDPEAADFDHAKLVGRKCLINVTHNESNGKTYANISSVGPIPDGMPSEYSQHNGSIVFDLSKPDQDAYDALPEWLKKQVDERLCDNMHEAKGETKPPADYDDDVPF